MLIRKIIFIHMQKKNLAIALFLAAAVLLAGWMILSSLREPEEAGGLRITASIYPLYYLAQEIAGEHAAVQNVVPAGAEPHDYELTARDLRLVRQSDILIINGALEPWADRISGGLREGAALVVAGEGLMDKEMIEDGEIELDPHIWLDPRLAAAMADRLAAAFITADPANAAAYEENLGRLKDRLADLDAAFKSGLEDCARRTFITGHSAFAYLAETYGLEQLSIAGLSPEAEPAPRALADLADRARQEGIRYIFFESLVSPSLAETLAREVGAETLVLNPLEGLAPEEAAAGRNYFNEMEANLENLRIALECR